MNIVIIYGTTYNTTKKIVSRMSELLEGTVQLCNAKDFNYKEFITSNECFIFVSPTYGDGELHIDIENLLSQSSISLAGKYCAICETGNYYGYDDYVSGAYDIMKYHLDKTECKYLIPHISLDTLPKIDWDYLQRWCVLFNTAIQKNINKIGV